MARNRRGVMTNAAIHGLGPCGRTPVDAAPGKSEKLQSTQAVSRDPGRVADFAAAHRLAVLPDLQAALSHPGIDAVVLATPHSQHVGEIIAAAEANKPVFCEKPLAL